MEKYLIVAWDTYYPSRGLDNCKDCHWDLDVAIEMAESIKESYDNVCIYELHTFDCIEVIK